jgi:hypothetical protein
MQPGPPAASAPATTGAAGFGVHLFAAAAQQVPKPELGSVGAASPASATAAQDARQGGGTARGDHQLMVLRSALQVGIATGLSMGLVCSAQQTCMSLRVSKQFAIPAMPLAPNTSPCNGHEVLHPWVLQDAVF